jgi:hypothetical protein
MEAGRLIVDIQRPPGALDLDRAGRKTDKGRRWRYRRAPVIGFLVVAGRPALAIGPVYVGGEIVLVLRVRDVSVLDVIGFTAKRMSCGEVFALSWMGGPPANI